MQLTIVIKIYHRPGLLQIALRSILNDSDCSRLQQIAAMASDDQR